MTSKVTLTKDKEEKIDGQSVVHEVRQKLTHTWTRDELHEVLKLPYKGEYPESYAIGAEKNYLDGFLKEPTPFYVAMNMKLLKLIYEELIDIVNKCLLGNYGSLEQISKIKVRLMAAIVDSAVEKKRFN